MTDSLLTKTTLDTHDVPCHGWSLSPKASCNRARFRSPHHFKITCGSPRGVLLSQSHAELRGRRNSHSRAFNCCNCSCEDCANLIHKSGSVTDLLFFSQESLSMTWSSEGMLLDTMEDDPKLHDVWNLVCAPAFVLSKAQVALFGTSLCTSPELATRDWEQHSTARALPSTKLHLLHQNPPTPMQRLWKPSTEYRIVCSSSSASGAIAAPAIKFSHLALQGLNVDHVMTDKSLSLVEGAPSSCNLGAGLSDHSWGLRCAEGAQWILTSSSTRSLRFAQGQHGSHVTCVLPHLHQRLETTRGR